MSNKTIGKDIANPIQREQFIKDNADGVENKGYMKAYTPEQLQGHKEKLANVSIEIAEIEAELKELQAEYKGRLKPLKEARANMVSNIKAKAEYVHEPHVTVSQTKKQKQRSSTIRRVIWWRNARQRRMKCNQPFLQFVVSIKQIKQVLTIKYHHYAERKNGYQPCTRTK